MRTKIIAERYHDFSYGHRVYQHEGKCAALHGHNGRVHFTVTADTLDAVGRVMDFSVIKDSLCDWVENNWDHRFIVWEEDPLSSPLRNIDPSAVIVPFNPTAENMAYHLLHTVGPIQLKETGVKLIKVTFEETTKCRAAAEIE